MLESTTNFIGEWYEGECCRMNHSQTYRTTTAQAWGSFTHLIEVSKKTKILKSCINSQ